MSQALALAVLAGLVSAGLALLPLSGSVGLIFFGYFVQLPLMLAGLTMGFAACLVAIVTALLINALIGGPSVAAIYAVAFALPSIIVVRQALLSRSDNGTTEWYPPGFVLAWLTVAAALGVVAAFAMFMGRDGGLLGLIDQSLTEAISQLSSGDGQAVPVPDLSAIRDRIWMIPAAVASSWLIMAVLNGIIAQSLAVRSGWNRRPSPNFSSLDLPVWLWPLMGIAAMLALVGGSGDLGSLGRTALIVLVTPFAFLGLAVIHKFANRWSHRQLGLAAIYAGIVVFNWPILAVVALGLVEDWAHLRRYM
ncbi:MAG: DUF2232 domain-containing protein [Geminicoccales bacterium]